MSAAPRIPHLPSLSFGAPPEGTLDPGDGVDLWTFPLDRPDDALASARRTLDDGERARAARFATPTLSGRFVARRAGLRAVLARYVGVGPEALSIRRAGEGRPRLVGTATPIVFSATHSDGLALVAVARRDPLGLDVERVREVVERDVIARRYFDPADAEALAAATTEEARRLAFFLGWTRLEARAKALDEGVFRHVERRDHGAARAEDAVAPYVFSPQDGFVAALFATAPGPLRAWRLATGGPALGDPEDRI